MSFSSLVERLILKKTSLLLSVTLMFKCSAAAGASLRSALGEPFSWLSDIATGIVGVRGVGHDPVAGRIVGGGGVAGVTTGSLGGFGEELVAVDVGELKVTLVAGVVGGVGLVGVAQDETLAGANEEDDDENGDQEKEKRLERGVDRGRRGLNRRLRHGVSQFLLFWGRWLGVW